MISQNLMSKYTICGEIGNGGMGKVYLAQSIETGKTCAIKQMNITPSNAKFINSEIDILRKLQHPAIPTLWDSVIDGESVFIVMDYMQGKELTKYIETYKYIPEPQALLWFKELVGILIYLHSLETPIVYRDLKPNNIIVDDQGHLKLIDFGIAAEYAPGEKQNMDMALTRGYAAPEQYARGFIYDVRTDIYSLGATMHYLLTGKNPNVAPYVFAPVTRLNSNISLGMESIVQKCLQPNPDDRFVNASKLYEALDNIDELTAECKVKKKKKNILISVLAVLAVAVMTGSFFGIRKHNETRINNYYDVVSQAYSEAEINPDKAYELVEQAEEMGIKSPEAAIAQSYICCAQGDYEGAMDIVREKIIDSYDDVYSNTNFLKLMIKIYTDSNQPDEAEYYNNLLKEIDG